MKLRVLLIGVLALAAVGACGAAPSTSSTSLDTATIAVTTVERTMDAPLTTVEEVIPIQPKASPTAAAPPPASLCGAPDNPLGYNFCSGAKIYQPDPSTCDYFNCIPNWSNGKGYMEECKDQTYSMSGGRQGSCSHHGGDLRPVLD